MLEEEMLGRKSCRLWFFCG